MIEERIKFEEKELTPINGWIGLLIGLIFILISLIGIYFTIVNGIVFPTILGIISLIIGIFILCGLKVLNPNEAIVLGFLGNIMEQFQKKDFIL